MTTSGKTGGPLSGRVVALPETRELDRMVDLLAKEGATTLSCPMIGIRDVAEAAPVESWLRLLAAGELDVLVFMTGEGVTRLLGFAERCGILAQVVAAMAKARIVTRGPKPARA